MFFSSSLTFPEVTHTDAVEMTGEPPKKLKVDVVVEEKSPNKVQIEEIIETSDDQGKYAQEATHIILF